MNNQAGSPRDSLFLRRGVSLGVAMKERDEDLTLFHDMRKREKEGDSNLLLPVSEEFEAAWGGDKISYSPLYKLPGATPTPLPRRKDEFLTADGDKNDYDWLLTPPGTPLFPSLEMDATAAIPAQKEYPLVRPLPAVKTSRLSNSQSNSSSKTVKGDSTSRQTTPTFGVKGMTNAIAKKSKTPKSASSSRTTTPLSSSAVPATKPSSKSSARSSTQVKQSSTISQLSSMQAQQSITPAQRLTTSAQRSTTPVQRSSPRLTQRNPPGRSSSASKASTMPSRNPALSRGTSPTVRSRPLQEPAMPGISLETPPNLKTEMPGRAVSATRGRLGSSSTTRSSTVGASNPSNKPKRQSCSPSVTRGRISNDSLNNNKSSLQASKHSNSTLATVPAVVGSKMVERLMSARRSNAQGPVEEASVGSILNSKRPVKSGSPKQSAGFGSTLSKKSLDMALRHMDIRRGTPLSFRSSMTNIPASSLYSVRSGSIKSKSSNKASSPVATSSNASSDYNARIAPDPEGSEFDDDDFGSETGSRCSRDGFNRQNSFNFKEDVFKGDGKSTNWLLSPTSAEDKDDHSLFSGQGFEMLSDPMDDATKATGFDYHHGRFDREF